MFGVAGLFGAGAFAAITACAILALSTAVAGWLAALIVAVVYAAIAGLFALRGKKSLKQATPPVPERAVDSTKEDLEWVKTRPSRAATTSRRLAEDSGAASRRSTRARGPRRDRRGARGQDRREGTCAGTRRRAEELRPA